MGSHAALFLLIATAALATGCAATGKGAGDPDPRTMIPPNVKGEWLHFTDATVSVGDPAPDFTLPMADDSTTLSLSTFRGRPLVLIFGSYT
ncbi:MAG: hypothetical protein ACYTDX_05565 [Planctomycetota bacterium]|jgi:cytochrome oxidase Cu insertion factor (SCO1/SenC/PrrC family)